MGDRSPVAAAFLRFADRECRGSSPLYERLSRITAGDPSLLELAALARRGQPLPNLFLAAVHAVLIRTAEDPLRAWFPDLVPDPRDPGEVKQPFAAFCRRWRPELSRLIATRTVATNEAARSALLYPAFALVASLAGSNRIHPFEIGSAGGLNLLWDRYAYDYGPGLSAGDPSSPVLIRCAVRGNGTPMLRLDRGRFAPAVGIDLHPIDAGNQEEALWLKALIWPEHRDRAERLALALDQVRRYGVDLRRGDGVAAIPGFAAALPPGEALCVYHSFTANQFDHSATLALDLNLAAAAEHREVFRIGIEWLPGLPAPTVWIDRVEPTGTRRTVFALCDPHGGWIEMLHRPT